MKIRRYAKYKHLEKQLQQLVSSFHAITRDTRCKWARGLFHIICIYEIYENKIVISCYVTNSFCASLNCRIAFSTTERLISSVTHLLCSNYWQHAHQKMLESYSSKQQITNKYQIQTLSSNLIAGHEIASLTSNTFYKYALTKFNAMFCFV